MSAPRTHLAYRLRLLVDRFVETRCQEICRRVADEGIQITTLAAEQTRDARAVERAYALHNVCRLRQPPVETRQTPIPWDRWNESFVDGPLALPDGYFIAVNSSEYVGVSVVHRDSEEAGILIAGFTGVLKAYAEQGIGLGLKHATIEYARERGYAEIRTSVLAENLPMLRINERLGFSRYAEETITYIY